MRDRQRGEQREEEYADTQEIKQAEEGDEWGRLDNLKKKYERPSSNILGCAIHHITKVHSSLLRNA